VRQAEPYPLAPGTLVHGRYRVVTAVGHGGLGTVYQVLDALYGGSNIYALKEQWDQSPSARKQFAREGAWLKGLNHRHIPKVTEYFEWNHRLYLVMEFVEGENLEQKLERAGGRPLPEQQVIAWILPICDALQYLHTRTPPIIHRDVKPSNIIVTPSGYPVLVDLGIAKEHGPGHDATATFVRKAGTEGYAPPEQYAAAAQAGPWSDVYGLGATLYHLLTTRIPPTAVERVALDARLVRPSELNQTVSTVADAAILRALAIRPQDRFRSMLEFQRALSVGSGASHAEASPSPLPPSGPYSVPGVLPPTPRSVTAGMPSSTAPVAPRLAAGSALATPAGSTGTGPRSTRPATASHTSLRSATGVGEEASADEDRVRSGPRRRAVWATALVAVGLILTVAAVAAYMSYTPLDRSTPVATVTGYFDALHAQDYARAWEYSAQSNKAQSSQSAFIGSLKADDARYGRVLSAHVSGNVQEDSAGHATSSVAVTRAMAATAPQTYTVNLTQYGSIWLIDSITGV
jgi:serine/threonine protein kinase